MPIRCRSIDRRRRRECATRSDARASVAVFVREFLEARDAW
jgi:hypothetical protein